MKLKTPFSDVARDAFIEKAQKPRIVTTPNAIVTYAFTNTTLTKIFQTIVRPEETDEKIREILAANSDVDLKQFEEALSITILNIQRKASPPPEEKEEGTYL